jgi:hypothetical protein
LEDIMFGRILAGAAALCLLAATAVSAQAEPRLALVMGNSNYGKEIGKLPNPANDATAMAAALQQTGFQVTKIVDADWKQMKRAIVDFGEKLTAAGPEATGLFFYAGHGVQVQGVNYLVPIGADISKEADVKIETVAADAVLEQMEFAGSRVNIIILDACRNNPMARGFRSVSRGLAPMDSVRGTFIAYSTSPGDVAADGEGANSPYTEALAKTLVQPGMGIEEAFREVRAKVMAATEEKQVPWDSSSLTAPFFFKSGGAAKPVTAGPSNFDADKALWDAIKDSKLTSDYQAYLSQYPSGTYASLARSRVASLGGEAAPAQPVVTPAAKPKPAPEVTQPAVAPAAVPSPAPEPEPAPVAKEANVSSAPAEESGGIFGSGQKLELDSRGVDCRINDSTRPTSDCRNTKKPLPKTRP